MSTKKLLLGNDAVARGAYEAGVKFVSSYPGTPSTEITECMAKYPENEVYVEWAPNEKVAAEAVVGAAIAGARAMTCCKHVGLNVMAGLHRSDLVVALGGGVVGDLSGFAAACYQRGIPFVQVPTTLLAAVDSSVGGKTAIDIDAGKNLVGAFYQPLAVYCDVDCIATMNAHDFADGVAESIKYGVLHNPALFDRIASEKLTQTSSDLDAIVKDCVAYKNQIVSEDEREKGTRQLLNLGHTFAHAIEQLSDFATSHGHAVAIGLAMMARACLRKGWSEPGTATRIERALLANNLPITCDYEATAMLEVCRRDKKAGSSAITIVVPHAIGDCGLRTVDYETLLELLQLGKEPL